MKNFDLVIAGPITKDIIVYGDDETRTTGGGMYYGAFPALLFGVKLAVIAKVADEDLKLLDEFRQAGIETIARPSRKTTSLKNVYYGENYTKRRVSILAVSDPMTMEDFEGIEAKIIYLSPLIRGEVSLDLVKKLSQKAALAVDIQGFARAGNEGEDVQMIDPPDKTELLKYVTYLKTDKDEAKILTGIDDKRKAAEKLSRFGPKEIIVTDTDGVCAYAQGQLFYEPFNPVKILGRTGRGDTTFAAYVANRIKSDPAVSLKWAAAVVSRKLEHPGPFKGPLPH